MCQKICPNKFVTMAYRRHCGADTIGGDCTLLKLGLFAKFVHSMDFCEEWKFQWPIGSIFSSQLLLHVVDDAKPLSPPSKPYRSHDDEEDKGQGKPKRRKKESRRISPFDFHTEL